MTQYRIEKMRRFVLITLRGGQRIDGEIFLRPTARYQNRPELPIDLLNDGKPFFPILSNGIVLLLAKANIAVVETSNELDDEFAAPVLGLAVEATLTDGKTCRGSVFLETRADRPRLLDFLNSYNTPFLALVEASRVFLVNTQSIAHVREVA
jgi:hypothetical protein